MTIQMVYLSFVGELFRATIEFSLSDAVFEGLVAAIGKTKPDIAII